MHETNICTSDNFFLTENYYMDLRFVHIRVFLDFVKLYCLVNVFN